MRAGSTSSSGGGGGGGGGGGRRGRSRQRSRLRRVSASSLAENVNEKMSPSIKKLDCFSPMLCHCKVACTNSTISLMFGCKVGACHKPHTSCLFGYMFLSSMTDVIRFSPGERLIECQQGQTAEREVRGKQ